MPVYIASAPKGLAPIDNSNVLIRGRCPDSPGNESWHALPDRHTGDRHDWRDLHRRMRGGEPDASDFASRHRAGADGTDSGGYVRNI